MSLHSHSLLSHPTHTRTHIHTHLTPTKRRSHMHIKVAPIWQSGVNMEKRYSLSGMESIFRHVKYRVAFMTSWSGQISYTKTALKEKRAEGLRDGYKVCVTKIKVTVSQHDGNSPGHWAVWPVLDHYQFPNNLLTHAYNCKLDQFKMY